MEVAAGVEGLAALGGGVGGDLEGVEEQRGHGGEDQVDEEAGVGLEAQDAGGDAEQRRGQALQVGEDLSRGALGSVDEGFGEGTVLEDGRVAYLGVVHDRLGHDGVDLVLALGRHDGGWDLKVVALVAGDGIGSRAMGEGRGEW